MTEATRIDKWLWAARFAKTRSGASRLCQAGAVLVEGKGRVKPSCPLRIGDTVQVPRGSFLHTVRVVDFATRRGPPAEARRLYDETRPPEPLTGPLNAEEPWTPLLGEF